MSFSRFLTRRLWTEVKSPAPNPNPSNVSNIGASKGSSPGLTIVLLVSTQTGKQVSSLGSISFSYIIQTSSFSGVG